MNDLCKNYKIGIILDSLNIEYWKILSLKNIFENKSMVPKLLIINENQHKKNFCEELFFKFEKNRSKFEKNNGLKKYNIKEFINFENILVVKKNIFFDFNNYYKTLKNDNLDVILSFTKFSLDSKIKKKLSLGHWYFIFPYSNSIPGFNEVFDNNLITQCNFVIEHHEFKFPKIFLSTFSATDSLYVIRNQNNIFWKISSFFPRLLNNIEFFGEKKFRDTLQNKPDYDNFQLIDNEKINSLKFFSAFLKYTEKYLKVKAYDSKYWDQFCILYNQSDKLSVDFHNFKILTPPADMFWADPQLIVNDGKKYLFFEEFSLSKNKGWISTVTFNDDEVSYPKKIIEENYHLSYPNIFLYDNDYYIIPESSQNRTIDLYKCHEFPYVWKFEKTLMKNVNASDSTVFYFDKKWWLFTNIVLMQGASSSDELFLFYSDNPTSSEWVAHEKNPIISDVRNARSGGHIFRYQNKIIRPAQNSIKGYGYGINLNEITKLNENEFNEKCMTKLNPDWDKKIKALHTLEYTNGLTVIDAKIQREKK